MDEMEEKYIVESMNIRLDNAEERIYKTEDGSFEITQSEENKERGMQKNRENLLDL